ncbi:MAG TPA: redoxin family protein [Methylomirabilota bacterium]|nr:redoxin family protein [Methylomirabilota bacterium]
MAGPFARGSVLRWLLVPVVLVPLGWLLFTGLGSDPRNLPSPLVGKPIPVFAGTTLEGDRFSSADLAGKPAVINFWASYCIPSCVDEHPVLLDLVARHGDEVQLVGVLVNDTPDGARGFLDRYGQVSWPTMLNPDGGISIDYGVTGPPETFFVDADGVVVSRHIGPLTRALVDEGLASLGIAP